MENETQEIVAALEAGRGVPNGGINWRAALLRRRAGA